MGSRLWPVGRGGAHGCSTPALPGLIGHRRGVGLEADEHSSHLARAKPRGELRRLALVWLKGHVENLPERNFRTTRLWSCVLTPVSQNCSPISGPTRSDRFARAACCMSMCMVHVHGMACHRGRWLGGIEGGARSLFNRSFKLTSAHRA